MDYIFQFLSHHELMRVYIASNFNPVIGQTVEGMFDHPVFSLYKSTNDIFIYNDLHIVTYSVGNMSICDVKKNSIEISEFAITYMHVEDLVGFCRTWNLLHEMFAELYVGDVIMKVPESVFIGTIRVPTSGYTLYTPKKAFYHLCSREK